MMPVTLAVVAFAATIAYLTQRYLRHEPRSFHRFFPDFETQLCTHRGYGKHGPVAENTVSAFLAAERLGFRAHELDVRRTTDRQIMLLHGPRLEVTTDGRGRMEDTAAAKISRLNAAHYVNVEGKASRTVHEPVPMLAEVLRKVSPSSLINVEIKRDRWDFSYGLEEEVLRIVLRSPAATRVCFSGFHFLTLWRLRRLRCPLPVGLLVEPGIFTHAKNFLYRLLLLPDNIHLHQSRESATYMRRLKKRGFGLAFWTVNDRDQVRRLFATGADLVITDRVEYIHEFRPRPLPQTLKAGSQKTKPATQRKRTRQAT